jgi:hypothetical protein
MVIYSVYYYSKAGKLQTGVVMDAADLKRTELLSHLSQVNQSENVLYSPAVMQSLGLAKSIPEDNFVGERGKYSKAFIEKIDEAVLHHFPNHPPIDFPGLKENDSVLFSYYFQQVMLPKGFFWLDKSQEFTGKKVRSLIFRPDRQDTVHRTVKLTQGQNYKEISFDAGDSVEGVYIVEGAEDFYSHILNDSIPVVADSWDVPRRTAVWLPDIDFYFEKYYDGPSALPELRNHSFKTVDERLKVKTTVPDKDPVDFYGKLISENGPVLFYLKNKKAATGQIYFALLIRNPEVLVPMNH